MNMCICKTKIHKVTKTIFTKVDAFLIVYTILLLESFFHYSVCMCVFFRMHVCTRVHAVPLQIRREHWIPWDWS